MKSGQVTDESATRERILRTRLIDLVDDWSAEARRSGNVQVQTLASFLRLTDGLQTAMVNRRWNLHVSYVEEPDTGDVLVTVHVSSR